MDGYKMFDYCRWKEMVTRNEKKEEINLIKEEVYQLIKETGELDLGYISIRFEDGDCYILCLAVAQLLEEGRVERKELCDNRDVYFVK